MTRTHRLAALAAVLAIAASISAPLAAAQEDDPILEFRRLEWESRASAFLAERGALGKIPFHEPVYDVTFYDLSVRIDPADSSLVGDVWVHAGSLVDTLERIDLDLIDSLTVDSVGGNGTAFTHANGLLTVELDRLYTSGESFAVRVYYGGEPRPFHRNGLIWKTHGSHPIVYTMVEPFFSNHWWPCKDVPWDKADSAEVTITFPQGLAGVSNGAHIATTSPEPGWLSTTWRHRYPIPPYLIMIALSNYELIADVYDNGVDPEVTIAHWVFPEDRVAAETTFALVPEMMAGLEEVFGPYPYRDERFGHAEVSGVGAMEHNTCVSFGGSLIVGNRGSDAVVVHELGHQWWGDLVTCEDWNDIWLNEGFATYSEKLWAEHRYGARVLPAAMKGEEYHGSQSVYVQPVPDLDSLFSAKYYRAIYGKGSWVLHMIRRAVGEEDFFDILERHKTESLARGGIANTEQFRATCEAESGLDLERFFRQWVYLSGSPSFRVLPFVSASGESLWVRFAQDPTEDTCFAVDIDLAIAREGGGDTTLTLSMDTWADTFLVAPGGRIDSLRFDPDNWLLDDGFAGPVDEVLAIDQDTVLTMGGDGQILLAWEVLDSFVTGVRLYSAPSDEGPWSRVQGDLVLPKTGSFAMERPNAPIYFSLRAVSDSLPGFESVRSNVVESALPKTTETLRDSTATNPYVLGGDPYGILFNLSEAGPVSIRIYDITGRLVREVFDGDLPARFSHRLEWDGRNGEGRTVGPGVYFVRFESPALNTTRKVVVLR